jgi:UDP-N-acetylglucosamine transferase subunit ALG13
MIFVTVGTQLPFDRMVRTVDQWAGTQKDEAVFAQIGPAEYRPKNMPWAEFLDADECRRKVEQADLVVAHAGMGSILTALELAKPVVVMPRLSALGEHRNDHQLATAKRLLAQGRIIVAFNEAELLEKLAYFGALRPAERIDVHASSALLTALRAFVEGKALELPRAVESQDALLAKRARRARPLEGAGSDAKAGAEGNGADGHGADVGQETGRAARSYSGAHIKSHLVGMLLLVGRLHPTELGRRTGRSRLDLPIDAERTLLAYWRDEAVELSRAWDAGALPVRVLLDQASPMPTLPAVLPGVTISVERDRGDVRGTGGVLRDVCADYDDEDWVLVANGAQLLFGSVRDLADRLAGAGGEVNVVNDRHGIPNGLMLLRCGVLRGVSDIGFHDMKEQVIPALARRYRVKVVSTEGLTSRPIHSLKDFTETLRSYYAWRANGSDGGGMPIERGRSLFSIREQGSLVAPSAVVHDAVILQGAVVEKGAVVVRSVVGQGARVRPGQRVFDEIVM